MVELDYQNLPPQLRFKVNYEKLSHNHHKAGKEEEFDVVTRVIAGNDMICSYFEGDPGSRMVWHNHHVDMYQIYIPLHGTLRLGNIDNDGTEHYGEASPGELLYLPPGARNTVEAVGNERVKVMSTYPEKKITRLDQVIKGESDNFYNPYTDPEYALEIDTLRGKVIQKNDDVVSEW